MTIALLKPELVWKKPKQARFYSTFCCGLIQCWQKGKSWSWYFGDQWFKITFSFCRCCLFWWLLVMMTILACSSAIINITATIIVVIFTIISVVFTIITKMWTLRCKSTLNLTRSAGHDDGQGDDWKKLWKCRALFVILLQNWSTWVFWVFVHVEEKEQLLRREGWQLALKE